ncbi:membrane protein insertion efficiency factor YidD [Sporosarcina sp. ITBMC105]
MKAILIGFIKIYQKSISPIMPPTCRFYPTCSHYGVEAIEKHGALKGAWLAIRRISKCHPFHEGGFDPVPEKNEKTVK